MSLQTTRGAGNIRAVNVDYLGEQVGASADNQQAGEEGELAAHEEGPARKWKHLQVASQWQAKLEERPELGSEARLLERTLERLVQTGRLKVVGADQLISTHTGRESVSSGSARSKSTTLDSGIQTTWNEHSAASSSAVSPTCGFAEDRARPPQAAKMGFVVVEKSAASAASPSPVVQQARARSLSSRREAQNEADANADCGRLEQVVIEDNQQVGAVQRRQLQRQPSEVIKQQARRRGFSLTRSFSFHKQTQPQQQRQQLEQACPPNRRGDIERVAQEARERTIESSEPERGNHTAGANLSSLFRSKSMRVVSQQAGQSVLLCDNDSDGRAHGQRHHRHQDARRHDHGRVANCAAGACRQHKQANNCQQATIDYLASAQQHHKRSFSMRRNSLLAFGKEELGGGAGKIALFLRRLFNLKRSSRRQRHLNERQQQHERAVNENESQNQNDHSHTRADLQASHGRLVQVGIVHHHHLNVGSADVHSRKNGSNECPPSGHTKQVESLDAELSARRAHQQLPYANAPSAEGDTLRPLQLAPSFEHFGHVAAHLPDVGSADESRESPSNSLIEILDCSPSLENSRRRLRQEEARNSSASRATWHLIKRSGSSLSQQSNASASTNKSTVSQQLRRHLDEAYKRHRDQRATSKREREFIDSIQVLRQASRHASLENSRASSKNRQASTKSARSHKAVATSAPNTSDDSCSSITSDQPSRFYADDDELEPPERASAQADLNTSPEWGPLKQQQHQKQLSPAASKCEHEAQVSSCCCLCSAVPSASLSAPSHELYQLACCPVAQQASSQLACCSLAAAHQPHQPIALNQSPSHASGFPETSDLCCPIWRSIIYSYCQSQHQQQQQHPSAALNLIVGAQELSGAPPTPPLPNVIDYQLEQPVPPPPPPLSAFAAANSGGGGDAGAELARTGHTFSVSSQTNLQKQQLHHQQHNTTIDLKIEIGAGLKKKLLGASGRASAGQRRAKQQAAASSSSAITSDSLDSTSGSSSSSASQDDEATASDCSSTSSSSPLDYSTAARQQHKHQQRHKTQMLKVADGNQILVNANVCETGAPESADVCQDDVDDSLAALSGASLVAS